VGGRHHLQVEERPDHASFKHLGMDLTCHVLKTLHSLISSQQPSSSSYLEEDFLKQAGLVRIVPAVLSESGRRNKATPTIATLQECCIDEEWQVLSMVASALTQKAFLQAFRPCAKARLALGMVVPTVDLVCENLNRVANACRRGALLFTNKRKRGSPRSHPPTHPPTHHTTHPERGASVASPKEGQR
jgi:hypothetical protein